MEFLGRGNIHFLGLVEVSFQMRKKKKKKMGFQMQNLLIVTLTSLLAARNFCSMIDLGFVGPVSLGLISVDLQV